MQYTIAGPGSTLIDLLRERAQGTHAHHGYTFLNDKEGYEEFLSFASLDQDARRIATTLRPLVSPGQRALLLYPPGLDYIRAFWGCLYAGVIAVPAYVPRSATSIPRIMAIVKDASVTVVLSTQAQAARLKRFSEQLPGLDYGKWITTDAPGGVDAADWHAPILKADSLAFLQYTSGSTNTPKGVALSHANILHNLELIRQAFAVTDESRGVSWLPPYHDMGLIGAILGTLYTGINITLFSPYEFLQNPIRWLQTISRTRATISGAPNFAYDLCASRINEEQRASLELSSWQVAFTGAEPVNAQTIRRFNATFAASGFRQRAWYSCYGLAEATLLVAGGKISELPIIEMFDSAYLQKHQVVAREPEQPGSQALVACGHCLGGQELTIVDPATCRRLPDEQVGEIWLQGESVARGYWQNAEATTSAFHARLADTTDAVHFLRTGDLGFYYQGNLFLTGRLKDMIILYGRNLYPQDIEWTVRQSHPGVQNSSGAAIAVEKQGHPYLVIIQELDRHALKMDLREVAHAIRQAILATYDVQTAVILLIKPGHLPKTSSGKVQHYLCHQRFLEDAFDPLYRSVLPVWKPVSEIETSPESFLLHALSALPGPEAQIVLEKMSSIRMLPSVLKSIDDVRSRQALLAIYLQDLLAHLLGVASSSLSQQEPLVALGLDSLNAVELQYSIQQAFGVKVSLRTLFDEISISHLAAELTQLLPNGEQEEWKEEASGNDEQVYLLSQGQEALWFLHQLRPESTAYHISVALRLHGPLDQRSLEQAIAQLFVRHPMLRTTFGEFQGVLTQQIQKQTSFVLMKIDASDWSEEDLLAHVQRESSRPFNLQDAPPIHLSLLHRSQGEHILLCVAHHILLDFWSLVLLWHDLEHFYTIARSGKEVPPSSPVTYHDYIQWQQHLLKSQEGEHLWHYWQHALAQGIPRLHLPTDRPRNSLQQQTGYGARECLHIDHELTARLAEIGLAQEATRYMVFLAAFATLLYRYTDQTTITIGSPFAGRPLARWAEVVGYFVNPLPIQMQFQKDMTFLDLLAQVRQSVLGAIEHQALPLPALVQRLSLEHDATRFSLFQVMFTWQQTRRSSDPRLALLTLGTIPTHLQLADLRVESIPMDLLSAQAEISLMMTEAEDGVEAMIEYTTDLFERTTILRFLEHFRTLLASIAADPQQDLTSLSLLSEQERHQLIWRASQEPSRCPSLLHHAIEQQAHVTPEAIAVIGQHQRLTYRELNVRAHQLAQYLGRQCSQREARIGVLLERTPEMIIALLAILKSGAAYVPLDATYPSARLKFMLADSDVELLLTQRSLVEKHGSLQKSCTCLFLDEVREELLRESSNSPLPVLSKKQLAYIIYTSGSTGNPKGVGITHESASTLLTWATSFYTPAELSVVLAVTSICFDLSVFELFVPLSSGGTILLARDAFDLPAFQFSEQLTLINTVPSAISALLDLGALPPGVRVVNVAGESLARKLVERIYALTTAEKVYNLYGPTEDTTYSTVALVPREGFDVPPIGRPITNTYAYLLDAHFQPVPMGVTGELYLGGSGLARGYLNRPDLTAERFLPDPFSGQAGMRLYRTGDLACQKADGQFSFLGRRDYQIKLRGYRIELEEIELALLEHAHIVAAVAHVWEKNNEEEKQLVAYIVPLHKKIIDVNEVKNWLQKRLPSYMVPDIIEILEVLPLTSNGKVDRRTLPRPISFFPEEKMVEGQSLTSTEQALTAIWMELLQLSTLEKDANFFTLGGHSLLLIRLLIRIRDTFQVDLPLQMLVETCTITDIAIKIDSFKINDLISDSPVLKPVSRAQYRKKIHRVSKDG